MITPILPGIVSGPGSGVGSARAVKPILAVMHELPWMDPPEGGISAGHCESHVADKGDEPKHCLYRP